MTTLIRTLIFFSSFFLALNLHAQHLKIRNYSFGYRVFEIASVGNNPVTIVPLLKDPSAYQNYLNTISYNSLYGAPGIQKLQNYYLDIEIYKDTESMFWKKHSLQTGLLITNKLVKSGLAIANQELIYTATDTTLYINQYSLTQNQKFLGANFGLNKRLKISNKFQFLTGLHLQGSFAFIHNYNQQLDSSTYNARNGRQTRTTLLSKIKGKNFFQWQVMIPLGLEFDLHKKQFFIRLEADAGIIGSRYRPKSYNYKEAHGAGLWLIYLLK